MNKINKKAICFKDVCKFSGVIMIEFAQISALLLVAKKQELLHDSQLNYLFL